MLHQTGLTQPFALDLNWDAGKGVAGLRAALAEAGQGLDRIERQLPHYRLQPEA